MPLRRNGVLHRNGRPAKRSGRLVSAGSVTYSSATLNPEPTTPEWLPEGAVAYADFVNGHYDADGAETTVASILVEDEAFASLPAFDPETDIDAGGLFSCSPVIAPALSAALLASGFTAVAEVAGTDGVIQFLAFDNPDWSQERFVDLRMADVGNSTIKAVATSVTTPARPSGVPYKAALTIASLRVSVSFDGEAVVTDTTATAANYNMIGLGVDNGPRLKTLAFYAARPDADLPALSALS